MLYIRYFLSVKSVASDGEDFVHIYTETTQKSGHFTVFWALLALSSTFLLGRVAKTGVLVKNRSPTLRYVDKVRL